METLILYLTGKYKIISIFFGTLIICCLLLGYVRAIRLSPRPTKKTKTKT